MVSARRVVVVSLWLSSSACGALESDEAKEAARVTRQTVARGVEGAREQIERVDLERVRSAWDATVDAVTPDPNSGPAARPEADPFAVPEGAIECEEPGRACTVTAAYAQQARDNASALARKVRLEPVRSPTPGMKIAAMESGSLGERFGLRTGDVVTHVNGVSLGSMQDTMMLYLNVRSARRFVVDYRRGDQELRLHVDVI